MIGLYLGACIARHNDYNIVYNDYLEKLLKDLPDDKKIVGDMLQVDTSKYDYVLASPPCNFWSRARGNKLSEYSKMTKHLLPDCIDKLYKECGWDKPFIIENVVNYKRYKEHGIIDKINEYGLWMYDIGRHIYITNVMINLRCNQPYDFKIHGVRINNDGYNQGGANVHKVFEIFLNYVVGGKKDV